MGDTHRRAWIEHQFRRPSQSTPGIHVSVRFPVQTDGSIGCSEQPAGTKLQLPERASGLEMLGEYHGSGTIEKRYLIRRNDGHVVLVSHLLYLTVAALDRHQDCDGIASELTEQLGRTISPGNVAYLIENKLRPLGILASSDEIDPNVTMPALGLAARRAVLSGDVVSRMSDILSNLFRPPVVTVALAGILAMDTWLVMGHGLSIGVTEILDRPATVLMICALTILAGGFHELGHAAASRYGGAEPGVIGVGIYLLWPAFFSDLTDSYRLSRGGRIRADLGGVYFNGLFMLIILGVYALTGIQWLLLLIVLQHLAVLQQFLPFLRLDGYYLVSDLAGVPDLFGLIRPILSGLIPGRVSTPMVASLAPKVRVIVTAWVLTTVSVLISAAGVFILHLPRIATATMEFVNRQAMLVSELVGGGAVGPALLAGLRLAALAIPVIGLISVVVRGTRSLGAQPQTSGIR